MKRSAVFLCFFLVFLTCFSISESTTSPDYGALMAFKSASDATGRLSSWSNASDPCNGQWLGVSCRGNRVTRLVLEKLQLEGPVDDVLRLGQLRVLSVKENSLGSPAPLNFSSLKNIKLLFLADNRFSGPFPLGVSHLRRLRRLDLSGNRFTGPVPPELSQLPHLLTLRLERNSFNGTLFEFPPALEGFNVSGNSLVGKIPRSLSVFPSSSFSENKKLCGKPLRNCSRPVHNEPLPIMFSANRPRGSMSWKAILAIVAADVAALGLIASLILYCCCWRRTRSRRIKEEDAKEENVNEGVERTVRSGGGAGIGGEDGDDEEMVFFEGCEGFEEVEDLLRASAEMLGKGSVGTTYKVVLASAGEGEDGGGGLGQRMTTLVVKRVRERRRKGAAGAEGGKREVDGLIAQIGRLRHENVVPLRAYHSSKDELLLVYDYRPLGSLHSLLHGNRGPWRTPLDWAMRLKLAVGAAKGLSFLHTACEPKLAHGHLTSSNILVDQDGNACISDFALDQLVPPPSLSSSTTSFSSPNKAYKAPELVHSSTSVSSKASQRSDVYSFGVILLEMLTGKMASEGEGGMNLVKWVRSNMSRQGLISAEVFDLELLRYKEGEVEMFALLQVAFLCLNDAPKERPRMSVVYKMIDEIRARGAAAASSNDFSSNCSPSLSEDSQTFSRR